MKKLKIRAIQFLYSTAILFLLFSVSGCYYDKEQELYPSVGSCDTSNITYSHTIVTILNDNCYSCHSGSLPQGGISFDTYPALKMYVDDGRIWGAVNHESGYSPMPQGRPMLDDCTLSKIKIWIDAGAFNN